MKKILICFLLLYGSISFGQVTTTLSSSKNYYTYVPLNVGATASTDQIIFSGASTRTKSDKINGSNKAYQRWMRYWIDSTQVITNRTFDTNITGWDTLNTAPETYEQVASGGGFTNAMHVITRVNSSGMINDTNFTATGKYRLQYSINITSLTATGVYAYCVGGRFHIKLYTATGLYTIDTVLTYNSAIENASLAFFQSGTGDAEFYVDNISWFPIIDSVSGYQKDLTAVTEDIRYYYSQSGQYITKTDTIYAEAEPDTVYSVLNSPDMWIADAIGDVAYILWGDNSSSESGYEIIRNGVSIDTTLANVIEYYDTTVTAGGTYNYRVRALGTYVNSSYSNVLSVDISCATPSTITVLSAIGSPTNIVLTWTDVVSDSVMIYKGTATNPTTLLSTVADGVQTYTDVTVSQGIIYYYRLRAFENTCETFSNYSATVFDTVKITDDTAPSIPTLVDAFNITALGGGTEAPADTVPTMSAFANVTTAPLSSRNIGYTILTNLDSCWVNVSVGDSMKKGALGTYDVGGFKGYQGDTIYTSLVASGSYSTTLTNTITAGGQSSIYSVTTIPDPSSRIWYVDFDANVEGQNGSFTNPWTDFNSQGYWNDGLGITWSSINAGDTIYVRGGTIYTDTPYGFELKPSPPRSFASGSPVIVAPYPSEACTLIVSNNAHEKLLEIGNLSNIIFTGFTMLDQRSNATERSGIMLLGNADAGDVDSFITVSNCNITAKGYGSSISLSGSKNSFNDNILTVERNEFGYEQDMFGINGGRGGHTIDGNRMYPGNHFSDNENTANASVTITATSLTDTRRSMTTNQFVGTYVNVGNAYLTVVSNTANTFNGTAWDSFDVDGARFDIATPPNGSAYYHGSDAHRDGIQISNIGYFQPNERLPITISNNLYVDVEADGTGWNNMLYNYGWTGTNDTRFLIYNNIFVNRKTSSGIGGIAIGRYYESFPYPNHNSILVFNNTIISGGSSGSMFTGWSIDTLIMKNNLFVKDAVAPNILNIENSTALWNAVIKDIDYNYYYELGGISEPFAYIGQANTSWETWIGTYDVNGASGNSTAVTFTEKFGTDIADYYTVTGRHYAVDLSGTYPFLATDILGNPRENDWDIGALQYQDGGITESNWKRIEPFLRNNESDFWKGLQK